MKRIQHIDNAKAIGMFLIIFSHIGIDPILLEDSPIIPKIYLILGSFYVPLFFIISGIFETKDIKKNSKRILLLTKSCIIFYIFSQLLYFIFSNKIQYQRFIPTTWFLFTLLFINLIVLFCRRISRTKTIFFLLIILITLIGLLLSYINKNFFYIGQSFVCLPFFMLGSYFKDELLKQDFCFKRLIIYFLIWFITWSIFYSKQNLSLNQISQNYIAFYIEAIFGSFFIIEISKLIKSDTISYYGRNTMIPLLVQMPIISAIQKFIDINNYTIIIVTYIFVLILSGLCIPIFSNKYYNIFK